MISRWEAWRRLLPVWLPAALLGLAGVVFFLWQSSDTMTRDRLESQVQELEESLDELRRIHGEARTQLVEVRDLGTELTTLYDKSFGSLEERLTNILREVEAATRTAGLLPEGFGYSAREDNRLPFTRFAITYSVEGQYSQIRQMLATLQQSPEMLIVDDVMLTGEVDAASRDLMVAVRLATYLSMADQALIERLNSGLQPELPEPLDARPETPVAAQEESPAATEEGGSDA